MSEGFDLLGDPIPEGFGRRGRPPHLVTDEKRLKVRVLLAFTGDEDEVADGLGITVKTLRKHYFRELADKRRANRMLKATLLTSLMKEAEAGNATAIDKLFKRLDKHDLALLSEAVQGRGEDKSKAEEKLGKKDQQRRAAGEVSGIFAPPAPPSTKLN